MSIKMYCVFAMESIKKMGGNRGKLAAMAGHGFLHSYWDAEDRLMYGDSWTDITDYGMNVGLPYRNSGRATKVCLIVETVDDLKALHDFYKPICGVSLVTDAGLTCFDGPTTTCLGIGPISEDKVDVNLSSLKVLI